MAGRVEFVEMAEHAADLVAVTQTVGPVSFVNSVRKHSGRLFAAQEELAAWPDMLRAAVFLARHADRAWAVPEMKGPFGVADLVLLVPRGGQLEQRLSLAVPPLLNEADARIVAALTPVRRKTLQEVSARTGLATRAVEARLPSLLRAGAAISVSGGIVRPDGLVPLGRVHAIEAKVRDWRAAITQCQTYASWADTATAVLLQLPRGELEAERIARMHGFGLALRSEWLVKPKLRKHPAGRRLWASEHVLASLRSSV